MGQRLVTRFLVFSAGNVLHNNVLTMFQVHQLAEYRGANYPQMMDCGRTHCSGIGAGYAWYCRVFLLQRVFLSFMTIFHICIEKVCNTTHTPQRGLIFVKQVMRLKPNRGAGLR